MSFYLKGNAIICDTREEAQKMSDELWDEFSVNSKVETYEERKKSLEEIGCELKFYSKDYENSCKKRFFMVFLDNAPCEDEDQERFDKWCDENGI